MGLAVAGLGENKVNTITQRLAGDWSTFTPAEQAAFRFTRKQARKPASITQADVDELVQHFGNDGAWQVIWWSSRCHYMTKVADAFQFTLEKGNPFKRATPEAKKEPAAGS